MGREDNTATDSTSIGLCARSLTSYLETVAALPPMTYPRPCRKRRATALRPLSAELSTLSRSDGSASLRTGDTHVLVAVHGPTAPRVSRWERYDRGTVSVAFSRGLMAHHSAAGASSMSSSAPPSDGDGPSPSASGGEDAPGERRMKSLPVPLPPGLGATERELEHFLRDALSSCIMLERYPRCVVQVVVQIVQADGGVLGAAVNCAVMALMDAGLAMRGLPVASTCVVFGHGAGGNGKSGQEGVDGVSVWLDPTAEEESGVGHSTVVLVTDTSKESLILNNMTFGSPLSLEGLTCSIEVSNQMAVAMVKFMRLAVEQKVNKELQTLWS